MRFSTIQILLSCAAERNLNRLGLLAFKPGCPVQEIQEFEHECQLSGLRIISKRSTELSPQLAVALYPSIFAYSEDDLEFGVAWKWEVIDYLASGCLTFYLVSGEMDVADWLKKYKNKIRTKYFKLDKPTRRMSPVEFRERVVRNFVHVPETDELAYVLWLFFESTVATQD